MLVRNLIKRLFGINNAGSVAAIWAVALPVVVGGIGLAMDVGTWLVKKQQLQSVADAVAYGTGFDVSASTSDTDLDTAAAYQLTKVAGSGTGISIVSVNRPPASGAYIGNANAVEVTLSQPQSRFFSALYLGNNPTAMSRAVALRQPGGTACVLGLDTVTGSDLGFTGSTNVDLNCIAASNSSSSSAITVGGNSSLNAENIYTVGGYSVTGNGALTTTDSPVTGGDALIDPYTGLTVPAYSGCDHTNYDSPAGVVIMNPGVYCKGVMINSTSVVTMTAGVYIIDRNTFKIVGDAVVVGTDVTIILTSSTGSQYADVDIAGGAIVTLTAPTSGTWSGILFYQDRDAPFGGNVSKFNGGSTTSFTGAIYIPSGEIQFTGNNTSTEGACTQIIAKTVSFSGNSAISAENCEGTGITEITVPGNTELVE